jgi:glycosyltransferase involved in cell wall biosynthesis
MARGVRRRIIIPFTYTNPDYFGGIERKILIIARWLRENSNVDAVLALSHVDSEFGDEYRRLGLAVVPFPVAPRAGFVRRVRALSAYVQEFDAIAIETHQFRDMLCGAMVRRSRSGLRHLYRGHTHIDGSEIPKWRNCSYHALDWAAQAGVDRYCMLSRTIAEECMRRSGISPRKVSVVHNGIHAIGPLSDVRGGPAPLTPAIAVVGQFERRKNQAMVVRAIAEMRRKYGCDVRARFVGGDLDGYTGQVEQLAAALGVSDLMEFVGARPDVYDMVGAIDVHVLGSDFEGIPTSMIEAMSIAKLVICTDVGGTSELVRSGENGILVRPGDHLALAEAMMGVFSTPAESWVAMRWCGYDTWQSDFGVDAMMRGICDAFARCGLQLVD